MFGGMSSMAGSAIASATAIGTAVFSSRSSCKNKTQLNSAQRDELIKQEKENKKHSINQKAIIIEKYLKENEPKLPDTSFDNLTDDNNIFIKLIKNKNNTGASILKSHVKNKDLLKQHSCVFLSQANKTQIHLLIQKLENIILTPNEHTFKRARKSAAQIAAAYAKDNNIQTSKSYLNDTIILNASTSHITTGEKLEKQLSQQLVTTLVQTDLAEHIGMSDKIYLFMCDEKGFDSTLGKDL